ncbi:MAG: YceI family protein, partial [Opitutales bacterium]
ISGTIVVDATSLTVTNPVMQEHLHGEGWLNTGKHGQIRFELGNVSKVEKEGRHLTMHATGDFTLHGVTKEITVPVRVTYLPGMLADRTNGAAEGDLLVIRSDFSVNRSDYGIKPGQMTDKVAEEVELRLSIAGAAPRS